MPDFAGDRLHHPVGAQSEHHLARLRQPRRRGEGAGRQAHRHRPAPRRPRGQGGRLAARAARQRRRAGARSRQPAAGSRRLRRGLHARLEQRPAAGARGRHAPPCRPDQPRRRPGAQGGVGRGRRCADALRPGDRPLRGRGAGARRALRDRGHGRWRYSLPHRLRPLCRALPRLSARAGGGDHLGAGRQAAPSGAPDRRGGRGLLLQLVRRRPAHQRQPDLARDRAALRADRQLRRAGGNVLFDTIRSPISGAGG